MEVEIKVLGVPVTVFCDVSEAEPGSANSPPVAMGVSVHGVYAGADVNIEALIQGRVLGSLKSRVLAAAVESRAQDIAESAMDAAE